MRTIAALALVVLIACDGGPSRSEFIAQLDAICAETNEQLGAHGPPAGPIEVQAEHSRRANAITRDGSARLRSLDAPDDLTSELNHILTLLDQGLTAADASTEAIGRDNARANAETARARQLLRQVNQAWADLGTTECQK